MKLSYQDMGSVINSLLVECSSADFDSFIRYAKEIGLYKGKHEPAVTGEDRYIYVEGSKMHASVVLAVPKNGNSAERDFSRICCYLKRILDEDITLEELARHLSENIDVCNEGYFRLSYPKDDSAKKGTNRLYMHKKA